jgi:1-deoxy-D-xylulose 5-phosphate reductoisomerase
MRTIALLGSTGSIGVSTLALVREFPTASKSTAWSPGGI